MVGVTALYSTILTQAKKRLRKRWLVHISGVAMRCFNVVVLSDAIECFEVEKVSRVDYTACKSGGETLVYKVSVSRERGKVNAALDRAASYCHYHAKNIDPDYGFVISGVSI